MPTFSAMVLAAGYGTRLRPLSDEIPKPLLPIGDRSLLRTLVEQLAAEGFDNILVNAHHHARQIEEEVGRHRLGARVLVEESLLGTAGGLKNALPHVASGHLVVLNGDIVGARPSLPLVHFPGDFPLVFAVRRRARGAGTVGLGQSGQIVRLRGETFGEEASGADYVGAARLDRALLSELPNEGCLIGDFALPWLRAGRPIATLDFDEPFVDVGQPSTYWEANLAWLRRHTPWPHVLGAPRGAALPARELLLGEGAWVEGEGAIARVVALPGARVLAPLSDAIVTARGQVVRLPSHPEHPHGA